jgi:hypothetical protein
MEGQIQWDGLVLPIAEVTWKNVLETASRLQGLDIDDEFFVTYTDEEGDQINVRNEVDVSEAIRWAQEQGVPTLCLTIPYAMNESDSDESWMEVGDSPKSTKVRPQEEASEAMPEEALDLAPAAAQKTMVEEVDENRVEQHSMSNDVEEFKPQANVDHEVVSLQANEIVHETPAAPEMVELAPIESVFTEQKQERAASPLVLTPLPFVFAGQSAVAVPSPVAVPSRTPSANRAKLLELMCAASQVSSEADEKEVFLTFLSNPENMRALVDFFNYVSVQDGIAEIARLEKLYPGSAQKTLMAVGVKILYEDPAVVDQLYRIPDLETLLPYVLQRCKGKGVAERSIKAVVVHENVTCDGCEASQDRLALAKAAGHRNDSGVIVGVRYKSATVPNYDLCETCEASSEFQQQFGPFLKIVDPATAPDVILCVLPGATHGMMGGIDNMDWRNPIAREFKEFWQSKRQNAFPQHRTQEATPAPSPAPKPTEATSAVAPPPAPAAIEIRCKHTLKTFETPHASFSCDICMKKQLAKTTMHGCRTCNFDICNDCNVLHGIVQVPKAPVLVPSSAAVTPLVMETPSPQAKFVSDVTLADGCVVRPGEKLNKVWRVRNSGSERWPAGTRIGHVGGDAFGGPLAGVEVPLAAPGEAVNVSVPFVMPIQPGRYTSYWRMMTPHPQNTKFGHRFWVTVNVVPHVITGAVPEPQGQARAFPGQILSAPPTVQGLRGVLPAPPPRAMPGSVAGSPVVASRPSAPRPPPPPPVTRLEPEEPIVSPDMELAVAQITEFGFADIDKIVKILKEVNGDAGAAIDKLLEDA